MLSKQAPRKLPATIEGAVQRYFYIYEKRFRGAECERLRLQEETEAKLVVLRKRAPSFYEEKLPQLINQAAQALLIPEITTDSGIVAFHECHRYFLRVLDELLKTQPTEAVDFQKEKDRVLKRDEYLKRHLYVRARISDLESTEFEEDELGDEGPTSKYTKLFNELDKLKEELRKLSHIIAKMEGQETSQDILFELRVAPRTVLSRVPENKLKFLETQIRDFLGDQKQNIRSMYYDKSIIEGMIAKLNLDKSKFSDDELNIDLPKEALDAYKKFYRDLEEKRRNEWLNGLLQNKRLRPKEGIILSNPYDVPEDVEQKFEQSEKRMRRKIDAICEQMIVKAEKEGSGLEEPVEPADTSPTHDRAVVEVELMAEQDGYMFRRIKEEPRDDYVDDAGYDVVILPNDMADDLEEEASNSNPSEEPVVVQSDRRDDDDSDISDYHDAPGEAASPSKTPVSPKPIEAQANTEPSFMQVISNMVSLSDSEDEIQVDIVNHGKSNQRSAIKSICANNSSLKRGTSGSTDRLKKKCRAKRKERAEQNEDLQILGVISPVEKVEVIQIDDN